MPYFKFLADFGNYIEDISGEIDVHIPGLQIG
jgi:hypothetical protein